MRSTTEGTINPRVTLKSKECRKCRKILKSTLKYTEIQTLQYTYVNGPQDVLLIFGKRFINIMWGLCKYTHTCVQMYIFEMTAARSTLAAADTLPRLGELLPACKELQTGS
jgi:hypothetical protein